MFDLRSARYFVAVAEELHFGRAAERLRMSQPPLSQAIRQLERDVGETLFIRAHRTVSLTPAGAAFLPECRRLLQRAADVEATPRLAATGMGARVTIGAVASALLWPLPEALSTLRRDLPHLAVTVHELDTHEVVAGLSQGRIDVAVARLSSRRTGVQSQILLRDRFRVLLPVTHPCAVGSGALDLARLADDDWVWLEREVSPDYHDDMSAVCRAAGFSPRAAHTARSIASQIALVQCGVGVTIVPATAVDPAPHGLVSREIAEAGETVALAVTTRSRRQPAEDAVCAAIAAVVSRDARAADAGNSRKT